MSPDQKNVFLFCAKCACLSEKNSLFECLSKVELQPAVLFTSLFWKINLHALFSPGFCYQSFWFNGLTVFCAALVERRLQSEDFSLFLALYFYRQKTRRIRPVKVKQLFHFTNLSKNTTLLT